MLVTKYLRSSFFVSLCMIGSLCAAASDVVLTITPVKKTKLNAILADKKFEKILKNVTKKAPLNNRASGQSNVAALNFSKKSKRNQPYTVTITNTSSSPIVLRKGAYLSIDSGQPDYLKKLKGSTINKVGYKAKVDQIICHTIGACFWIVLILSSGISMIPAIPFTIVGALAGKRRGRMNRLQALARKMKPAVYTASGKKRTKLKQEIILKPKEVFKETIIFDRKKMVNLSQDRLISVIYKTM